MPRSAAFSLDLRTRGSRCLIRRLLMRGFFLGDCDLIERPGKKKAYPCTREWRTCEPCRTAKLLHKAINHREPEAAAFPDILRGEERIERSARDILRHTRTCVGYIDANVFTRCQVRRQ